MDDWSICDLGGGKKKKKKLGFLALLPLIVWNIPATTACARQRKQSCADPDKRRIDCWLFLLSFPKTMSGGLLNPQCWDADTPGVAWTKLVDTQEPRYTVTSSCCSTPTHPPLTAVHKIKSEKHKDKAERWHFMLSEGGFLIFAHFRVTKVQR